MTNIHSLDRNMTETILFLIARMIDGSVLFFRSMIVGEFQSYAIHSPEVIMSFFASRS